LPRGNLKRSAEGRCSFPLGSVHVRWWLPAAGWETSGMSDFVTVTTTTDSLEGARRLSASAVEARLAAALAYRTSPGTCPMPTGTFKQTQIAGASAAKADGTVPKSPWQQNRIYRH